MLHVALFLMLWPWRWASYRVGWGWVAGEVGATASLYYEFCPYKVFVVLNIYFLFSAGVPKPPAGCLVEPSTAPVAGIAFSPWPHEAARKNKDPVSVL
ncbi:hypothetical protein LV564_07135 [Komagataeibacter nataicola]|uniref:hypothetical protein n=1 Tax=Komagataeibacter nataicola TaxID=265960 RepID=UPI0011B542B7|nr:hypothetical protein [Komagataeibacter nataicola]WEQ56838.1 hypothetical protein LV564_07135 [Komagataeibacter nataicola]